MAQIAIVGTPGSGKTVFLSVLAMRYRSPQAGGHWLEWKNPETQRYVSETWDTLNRQEWPASTQSNKDRIFPLLEWTLHTAGQAHSVRVIDSIGQDVRAVFESRPSEWNEAQRKIRQELERADMVLFLVNLQEVIDAQSQGQVDAIEIPIKLAVENAVRLRACFALLLSQHDRMADHLAQLAIGQNDPADALRHFLPQLAGYLDRLGDDRANVFYVAAVADTVAIAGANSVWLRCPKRDFKSEGLDAVVAWTIARLLVIEQEFGAKRAEFDRSLQGLMSELASLEQRMGKIEPGNPPGSFGGIRISLWIAVVVTAIAFVSGGVEAGVGAAFFTCVTCGFVWVICKAFHALRCQIFRKG